MRMLRPAALLAVIALGLGGCAPLASELPAGISVTAFQTRPDYAIRQLELKVANDSAAPLTVLTVELHSSRFSTPVRFDRPQRVPVGAARDLPVRLSEPTCLEGAPVDEVLIEFQLEDGRTGTSTQAIDDTSTLDRITAEDCLAVAVAEHAAIAGPAEAAWTAGARASAVLDFTVTPTGTAGTLTISAVRATVLLSLADEAGAAIDEQSVNLVVDDPSATAVMQVRVLPARCDPHAIAEDKRGTFFPVDVAVTDGPSGTIDVPVSDAVRASLYEYIADWCGLP